jgi:class 3 adenylate cyclase
VHITALAIMGGIEVIVPEGIGVTMDGIPIMGGRGMRVKEAPPLPGAPHIFVHAFPIMGGVQVKSGRRHGSAPAVEPPTAPPPASRTAIDALPTAGTVTVMFADMCDYSGIHERLGDSEARRVAAVYARIVRERLQAHDGVEIKCNGDGFMVAFQSALSAVRCAVKLQQALDDDPFARSEKLRAHVGIHAGEVVREDNDLHGATVILASRLAEAAAPGEVVISALTRELCRGTQEFEFSGPHTHQVKGIGERETYSVGCVAG